ncbi:DUF6391 domain-containing protein [Gloeocapsopsis dulcis]|uniref:Uncharacterized protein n=1 Tax=Gloeocapsopsis dulcis AAB1 = 1H9 TaxID=1433147 RepID=A0A6N8FZ56_9CHRO|nr:DUF6391 domain-containing protein [Gloeocapsopsis dulcis]MUL38373.1 hypothetical protein [Gloeocapsopsis dulcis AAB1 = 1H9]WNN91583.1 DUF6391 domain-containing protein [Gloeocapsopsis dulcis]
MNTFTDAKSSQSIFTFFDFDSLIQPTKNQDTEIVKQLAFIPGIKDILMLRQVHALEHATVWVLSELNNTAQNSTDQLLGGLSTEQGFYLYGHINQATLHSAVKIALQRLIEGEWRLAIHPRCGTNISVGFLLAAGLTVGFHLLLPRGPIEQFFGLGLAATTAAYLAPDVGMLAQRYLTTAIPFNLAVENIKMTRDVWGQTAHFIAVRWIESSDNQTSKRQH